MKPAAVLGAEVQPGLWSGVRTAMETSAEQPCRGVVHEMVMHSERSCICHTV